MKIKLCGMFRPCDISYANAVMPDYIGFVFAKSKRRVTREQAREYKKVLDKGIKAVGVFVNEDIETIRSLCEEKIIDVVQLHGDESLSYQKKLRECVSVPIIRACKMKDKVTLASDLERMAQDCDYLLLDSYQPGTEGGTGISFAWNEIPNLQMPFFLAGGIGMHNIAEAVKVTPYAIDVSSGIETDGVKDFEKMKAIVSYIREYDKREV